MLLSLWVRSIILYVTTTISDIVVGHRANVHRGLHRGRWLVPSQKSRIVWLTSLTWQSCSERPAPSWAPNPMRESLEQLATPLRPIRTCLLYALRKRSQLVIFLSQEGSNNLATADNSRDVKLINFTQELVTTLFCNVTIIAWIDTYIFAYLKHLNVQS